MRSSDRFSTGRSIGRRTFLKGTAGVSTVVAGSAIGAAQSGFGGWFDDVSNYDGVVDETGKSEVTVEVGVQGNNGAFAFGPAAVRVDPGTTVVWEWTGDGGSHNVVAENGTFESELASEAGHTFEHAFEETGVFKYACVPHRSLGMKGAIVVGKDAGPSGSSQSGSGQSGSGQSGSSGSGQSASGSDQSGSSQSASDQSESNDGASRSGIGTLWEYVTLGFAGLLVVVLLALPVAETLDRRES